MQSSIRSSNRRHFLFHYQEYLIAAVEQVIRPGDDEFPDALDGVEPEMLNKRFLVIDAVALEVCPGLINAPTALRLPFCGTNKKRRYISRQGAKGAKAEFALGDSNSRLLSIFVLFVHFVVSNSLRLFLPERCLPLCSCVTSVAGRYFYRKDHKETQRNSADISHSSQCSSSARGMNLKVFCHKRHKRQTGHEDSLIF